MIQNVDDHYLEVDDNSSKYLKRIFWNVTVCAIGIVNAEKHLMGHPRPLFMFIFVFFTNEQYHFYNKSMWKNVHPVYDTGIRTNDFP